MASCSYCNSFILFGGATDESGRYCTENCQKAGYLVSISQRIPEEALLQLVDEVHQGECPRCQGRGPIDVHKAHSIWSALILTSWTSDPEISCKRCAIKRQLGATAFSGTLGWWGFPWGIVMTPFQIIRNVIEIFSGPSGSRPSPLLHKHVAMQAAGQLVESSRQNESGATSGQSTPPPGGDSRFEPK